MTITAVGDPAGASEPIGSADGAPGGKDAGGLVATTLGEGETELDWEGVGDGLLGFADDAVGVAVALEVDDLVALGLALAVLVGLGALLLLVGLGAELGASAGFFGGVAPGALAPETLT